MNTTLNLRERTRRQRQLSKGESTGAESLARTVARQCSHEFSPSIVAGGKLPKAPSHHREAVAKADKAEEPKLQGYHGMGFSPPNGLFMQSGALKAGGGTVKAGETALLIVPRPPFDCVWRPVVVYDLRLGKPQLVLHGIKSWLGVGEKWQIYPERQGARYNEWMKGLWMTNSALNKVTAGAVPVSDSC